MRRGGKIDEGLRTPNILMDIRSCIIAVGIEDSGKPQPIKLSEYYKRISDGYHVHRLYDADAHYTPISSHRIAGDRAAEQLQDAVRQLVEARKNSKAGTQIKSCQESLQHALRDTLRFGGSEVLRENGVEVAAGAIDAAIVQSITKRRLEQIASRAG